MQISTISPSTFDDGKPVTLTGSGFGSSQGQVLIGGVAQNVNTWSDTSITFTTVRGSQSLGACRVDVVGGSVVTPRFSDYFASGATTSANGFTWNSNSRVVSGTAYSDTYAMRFRYGPDAVGFDSTDEQGFAIASSAEACPTEIWLEFRLYLPSNFTIRNEEPNNNKLLAIYADNYSTVGDIQVVFEFARGYLGDNTKSRLRVLSMSGTGMLNGTYHTHVFDSTMTGQWHRMRFWLKAGNGDGEAKMWRNDTLVFEIANYALWYPGGHNYWRNGKLMGYANSGYDAQTDFFVDDFVLYDTNPGWV